MVRDYQDYGRVPVRVLRGSLFRRVDIAIQCIYISTCQTTFSGRWPPCINVAMTDLVEATLQQQSKDQEVVSSLGMKKAPGGVPGTRAGRDSQNLWST